MIDPGHMRDTTKLEKKDRERGETGEGETEIRNNPGRVRQENRMERRVTATAENTAETTGGKRRRARAGVEGILARNKFFSPLCYLYSL